MTQQLTAIENEFPGLERISQRMFELPYAELILRHQGVVRRVAIRDAAEEMLLTLKAAVCPVEDCGSSQCRKMRDAIAKAEGRIL